MSDVVEQLAHAKYLNLETFRKSGVGVRTPVWFAQDGDAPTIYYVYSESDAGKVKRIRNNPNVRIAACNVRGNLRGDWANAQARICGREEAARGQQLLRRKYGLAKIMADFFARLLRHNNTVIAISVS